MHASISPPASPLCTSLSGNTRLERRTSSQILDYNLASFLLSSYLNIGVGDAFGDMQVAQERLAEVILVT